MTLPPEPIRSHLRQLEHEEPKKRMQALREVGELVRISPDYEVHVAPALIRRINQESDAAVHEQLINTILTRVRSLREQQHEAFAHYHKAVRQLKEAFSNLTNKSQRFERQSAIAKTLGEMATPESVKALFELGKEPDDFRYGVEPLPYGLEVAGQEISSMGPAEKEIIRKDARYTLVIARVLSKPHIYLVYKACKDPKQTDESIAALVKSLYQKERGY